MAAQLTAAYQALKEKKEAEKLLPIIKPMIVSANADGITDRGLIEIINSLSRIAIGRARVMPLTVRERVRERRL